MLVRNCAEDDSGRSGNDVSDDLPSLTIQVFRVPGWQRLRWSKPVARRYDSLIGIPPQPCPPPREGAIGDDMVIAGRHQRQVLNGTAARRDLDSVPPEVR